MIIKTRGFSANEGDPSIGNAGPDAIEQDLDNLYNNSKEIEDTLNEIQVDIDNIVAGGTIPLDHSSSDIIYGLGTTTKHGHVKIVDDLTKAVYADGEALSAYQGKVLKDTITDINILCNGYVVYTDTLAIGETITKYIPMGASKTKGILTFKDNSGDASEAGVGLVVINTTEDFAVGVIKPKGVTVGINSHFLDGRVGSLSSSGIYILSTYISGQNIVIVLKNSSTSAEKTLNTRIDWEAW